MPKLILFKMLSLHVHSQEADGLKLGSGETTGTMAAVLDERSEARGNLGVLDTESGAIQLQWEVVVTVPSVARAFSLGKIPHRDGGHVRLWLEESGRISDDGSQFEVKGTGHFQPGSALSRAKVEAHQNLVKVTGTGKARDIRRALANGEHVQCAFEPRSSFVVFALPKSLGGGHQHLHLVGGFTIVPIGGAGPARTAGRAR